MSKAASSQTIASKMGLAATSKPPARPREEGRLHTRVLTMHAGDR